MIQPGLGSQSLFTARNSIGKAEKDLKGTKLKIVWSETICVDQNKSVVHNIYVNKIMLWGKIVENIHKRYKFYFILFWK